MATRPSPSSPPPNILALQFGNSALRQFGNPSGGVRSLCKSPTTKLPTPSAPPKRKGEFIEAIFLAKCIALGFNVCKPWGDSARFDFMLEREGHRPLRIQLK